MASPFFPVFDVFSKPDGEVETSEADVDAELGVQ